MPGVHFHAAVSITYEFCSVLDTTSWIFTEHLLVSHTLAHAELATRQVTISTCTSLCRTFQASTVHSIFLWNGSDGIIWMERFMFLFKSVFAEIIDVIT